MGLILLATTPGGILSNLITDIAKGDVALSVSLTLALSTIYVFTLPFIAHFALLFAFQKSQPIDIPFESSISHIMMVTLIPISCGMLAAHLRPRWCALLGPAHQSGGDHDAGDRIRNDRRRSSGRCCVPRSAH